MLRARPLGWWFAWLAAFYGVWGMLVLWGGHHHTLLKHGGIALAMAVGSYVAGSTPMGGGSVGFPILVLLFEQSARLGRDFSFAIQSIGMTSATIFILCRRLPLEWPVLRHAMIGSLLGTPLGILWLAPVVPDLAIKLVFGVIWASFGVLHVYRFRTLVSYDGLATAGHPLARNTGLFSGFLAGLIVASVTGVGSDMVVYAVLVLLFKSDLKIAIPTSVVIMAFTSLVGITTKGLVGGVQPGTFENWIAAAPVVALGAPLGAFIVEKVGRVPTLLFVSLLCVLQFAWLLQVEWKQLGWSGAFCSIAALFACNLFFEWLYRLGTARPSRNGAGAQLT